VRGNPDLSEASTSYVEPQNLTMRMGMRRFTQGFYEQSGAQRSFSVGIWSTCDSAQPRGCPNVAPPAYGTECPHESVTGTGGQ
jgi:hypothetical protein